MWQAMVKFCPGFLFHRRRKTTNLIENEIHVKAETIFISKHSAILASAVISKYSAILARNILRFCHSAKERK